MPELLPWLLLIHVLAAIVGVGPTFAFPLVGAMGGREPAHANFATRVSLSISERFAVPLVAVSGLTGIGMIWAGEFDVFSAEFRWLLVAIGIYVATYAFALFVQLPAVKRVVAMTSGGPPPGAAAGAPAGPPPALVEAITVVKRNSVLLMSAWTVIVFLMVVKPTLGT
ncbi:MAG: DUF2269 family protein [Chloroflexota bacterium]|nr:DUF2269 family protein [Chloroflexota bacterium]